MPLAVGYRCRILTGLCALILTAAPASAQSQASTGQIAGCVADTTGAALASVTVSVTSSATGWGREVVTNEQGCYSAPSIPVGVYELAATLKGFRTEKAADLRVTVGSVLRVDLRLQVGTVSETVTVTHVRSGVDVASPIPSTTYDATAIAMLPINGRRFQDLFVLTPGAQVDLQRGQLALSGQRGINANISIDGADYNQPYFGGIRGGSRSNFAPTIPQEAIDEFNVIASGYSVEFGRSSGGVVHVVTKSGTNQPLGSAFYLNRHRDLAARNVFGQRAAPTQQQWGGSYGAPIRRNESFFFVAYEQQEISVARQVAFTALQGLTPTAETQEAFDHYKRLEGPFTETNDALTFLARFDWQPSVGNRFNLRYSSSRNTALNAISSGNATAPTTTLALSSNGTERDGIHTVVGQFTRAHQSTLVLEVRGQYSREDRPRDANAIETRVQNDIGRFGTTSFLGQTRTTDWRGQLSANATWLAGTHVFKAGTELNHVFLDETVGLNQTGAFMFQVGRPVTGTLEVMSTGGPTANRFDSPHVTYLRQIGNLQNSRSTEEAALFAQDVWRVRPDLTVTYGLRWEGQWHPPPEADNPSLINRIAGFTFPSGRQVDPTFIPDGVRVPAPRAGFAWDSRGGARTIVRGEAGVYDARSPGIIFTAPHTNFRSPPADLSVQLPFSVPANNPHKTIYQQLAVVGIDLNQTPLDRLPIVTPDQIAQVVEALGLAVDPYLGAQPLVVDPGFRNPRAYQWGAGVERMLGGSVTVGADYHDIKTVNLERNIDLNLPSPVIRDSSVDPAQRPFFGLRSGVPRPVPSLGQITVRESTSRSQYRALTLRTRVRRSWGELSVFYVLSKALSDDDNEADAGGMVADNAYDLRSEYSFARLDRRHQFSGIWTGRLPYGLETAGSFQFRSGVPIDARVGGDLNEDLRGGADRPYRAPEVPFQRNAFRNRPTSTVDLHLRKNLTVAEGRSLSFTVDVFNLFNVDGIQYAGAEVTTYCASPVPRCGFEGPTHPNFLQLRDSDGQYLPNNTPGEPRQIQLGLRLSY
jgi:hypothetical protein